MRLAPITFDAACEYITTHHRHHKAPRGWKFGTSVVDDTGQVLGVIMVGRPVARLLDDGSTLEVIRCCTNGTPNVASMLYGAAWRAAKALGYKRVITYILSTEPGTSLKAAGWRFVKQAGGGTWNREARPRTDKAPIEVKQLWEAA